jgi:hypothetical protein
VSALGWCGVEPDGQRDENQDDHEDKPGEPRARAVA